jgi:putative membrane protein
VGYVRTLKHLHPILFMGVLAAQPAQTPDARFVIKTAQANLAEVQMSAWAKEHALSDEVRAFAAKVLDDHTKLADELRVLAVKESATPVADLDPKDAIEIERQKTLEPNLLDRAYMREVMKWHLREAEGFRRELDTGKDQGLRTWAARMLVQIQAHIKLGEDTERAIGMEVIENGPTRSALVDPFAARK